MKTSVEIDQITLAVIGFQEDVEPIERSKVVKTGKYEFRYAPLDKVKDFIKPLMKKHGLGAIQGLDMDAITTRLVHKSGQWIESETYLNRDHANMQGFGGETTYKKRYALCSLLGIVSDDDTDVPKVTARGALTDAMDSLSTRKQNMVTDLAEVIKQKFAEGHEISAYEEYQSLTDNEEIMALWSLLPSNVRSAIKRMVEADKTKG